MRMSFPALLVLASFFAFAASQAFAAEATFERNYRIKGVVQLSVGTSLGSIHIGVGVPSRIHLICHVKSNRGGNVEASTGSGCIFSERYIPAQQLEDKRSISAKLNGGGPTVRIQTDTGDVRVH